MKKTIVLLFILLTVASYAFAQEAFVIEKYDIDIDIAEDRVYTISEDIDMFYTESRRGFYRDIPYRYNRTRARIKVLSASEKFEPVREGDYYSLKFGDEDIFIRGEKDYQFSYTYDLGADNYSDYDEFYYNIIGSWDTTIENITFKVTFPKPIDKDKVWLTSGLYGSTSSNGVNYNVSSDGRTITGTADILSANQSITLRVEMEEGYFVGAYVKPNYQTISLIAQIILSLGFVALVYFFYKKYGVDKDLYAVPRFEPPEGLSPMDAGFIIDEVVDEKDVSSMFFYWADKGYLTIEEVDKDEFVFHKVKDLPSFSHPGELALFNSIFKTSNDVTQEEMGKNQFPQDVFAKVHPGVKKFFKGERAIYSRKSKTMSSAALGLIFLFTLLSAITFSLNEFGFGTFVLLILGFFFSVLTIGLTQLWKKEQYTKKRSTQIAAIVLVVITSLITIAIYTAFGWYIGNNVVIAAIISILTVVSIVFIAFTSIFIEKRSDYGHNLIEQILGYRDFLDKVEVDKLKKLIDEDPEYFYHNLSWAVVFGLEDKWANKFNGLYVQPASWYYSSHFTVGDYLFYSAMTRRWRNAYRMSVIPAAYPQNQGGSSTHSGFSGFSGGGFGGGGGRSW